MHGVRLRCRLVGGYGRGMRLTGAFFANHAEVVDEMLNVTGGCWSSTTVQTGSTGFGSQCVILCEAARQDRDRDLHLSFDAAGPSGTEWKAARTMSFTPTGRVAFLVTPPMILPIEPQGGRHVYTVRLDGHDERIEIPLLVYLATP
jgi:hypothetical protein